MYSGLIIKESLINERILDEIEIVNVEIWKTDSVPKYWTAISFNSNNENFPEHLAKAIGASSEAGMVWYVDMQDANCKYIVLKDIVLKYRLGNEKEKRTVCARCIELGVNEEQLDWIE